MKARTPGKGSVPAMGSGAGVSTPCSGPAEERTGAGKNPRINIATPITSIATQLAAKAPEPSRILPSRWTEVAGNLAYPQEARKRRAEPSFRMSKTASQSASPAPAHRKCVAGGKRPPSLPNDLSSGAWSRGGGPAHTIVPAHSGPQRPTGSPLGSLRNLVSGAHPASPARPRPLRISRFTLSKPSASGTAQSRCRF